MAFSTAITPVDGKRGIVTATINGRVVELGELKNISANIKKKKSEFFVMGESAARSKSAGWSGTGSASYHYISSEWTKMLIDYAQTGYEVLFDITIVNEDPASPTLGKQRVRLLNCSMDGGDIAKLDVGVDLLDSSFSFTFNGVSGQYFNDYKNL